MDDPSRLIVPDSAKPKHRRSGNKDETTAHAVITK
jgi:hypothetical protein